MKGLVKPHCDALKKGFETAPADDKAWGATCGARRDDE
jgi:hypothetical protein